MLIRSSKGEPITSFERWSKLAKPKHDEQWVEHRSAYECARAWCGGDAAGPHSPIAVPPRLRALLDSHPDTRGCDVSTVIPEHKVRFDKLRGEVRNSDVCAIAEHSAGRIAFSIEAKVDEPFGSLVGDKLDGAACRIAADERTRIVERIQDLAESLLPAPSDEQHRLGKLRYQLLTGIAGSLAYAMSKEVEATRAVFIVHEFVTNETNDDLREANQLDLERFVQRLTSSEHSRLLEGVLIGPISVPGRPLFARPVPLYIGKAVERLRSR